MEPKRFRKREAILSCLRSTKSHPSADWVFSQVKPLFPDISLGTVYRNLSLFKEQGLIMSLGTVQGVERFDANTSPHVHYVCNGCGAVSDLEDIRVPEELCISAAQCSGGKVESCQLTFTGLCKSCFSVSPGEKPIK